MVVSYCCACCSCCPKSCIQQIRDLPFTPCCTTGSWCEAVYVMGVSDLLVSCYSYLVLCLEHVTRYVYASNPEGQTHSSMPSPQHLHMPVFSYCQPTSLSSSVCPACSCLHVIHPATAVESALLLVANWALLFMSATQFSHTKAYLQACNAPGATSYPHLHVLVRCEASVQQ